MKSCQFKCSQLIVDGIGVAIRYKTHIAFGGQQGKASWLA